MADERKDSAAGTTPVDEARLLNAVEGTQTPETTGASATEYPFLGFTGSYTHGIDAKGRMIIPASFREALGPRFVVCPTPDFQAVALYPLSGWIARRDMLLELVKLNARAQRLLDQFSKYSYVDCEADAQGRVLLPAKIRAWRLGDARDVDVNGATDHIRVLPAADSKAQDDNFDIEFADPLALIAQMQQGKGF